MSKRSEKSREFAKNIRSLGKEANVFAQANFLFVCKSLLIRRNSFSPAVYPAKNRPISFLGAWEAKARGGVPFARRRNRKTRRPKIFQGEYVSEKEKGRLKERGRSLSVSKEGAPTNGKDPGDSLLKGESRLVGINTKTQKER